MKDKIKNRLDKNLNRARNLVDIFENYAPKKTKKVNDTDILRAATVFLHATLEDFLRSIAAWKLPLASPKILNDIPLLGKGKDLKFSLGDLASRRSMKVDKLIKLSVDEHLERSNYNNVGDISHLLEAIGIKVKKVNGTFNNISELMKRRHQIVHRVDRKLTTGKAVSLTKDDVNRWINVVEKFTGKVLNEIFD